MWICLRPAFNSEVLLRPDSSRAAILPQSLQPQSTSEPSVNLISNLHLTCPLPRLCTLVPWISRALWDDSVASACRSREWLSFLPSQSAAFSSALNFSHVGRKQLQLTHVPCDTSTKNFPTHGSQLLTLSQLQWLYL